MSQKTDNLIKLALVFFVSLLSFSIGTYVGKKYSDNQHKLALLEPQKETPAKSGEEFVTETAANGEHPESQLGLSAEGHTADTAEASIGGEKPAALTDSEVAKIAEEFAIEEESTEGKIVASIEPIEAVEKPVGKIPNTGKTPPSKTNVVTMSAHIPDSSTEKLPAKVIAAAPATSLAKTTASLPPKVVAKTTTTTTDDIIIPSPTDDREPASIPPAQEVVPIHYTVQIGSFPTQLEAESLTKNLQNKGYKTSFVPAKVNGQIWYRVNVGLFGTIQEAQDYKKEFLEKTKLSSAIVQRLQR